MRASRVVEAAAVSAGAEASWRDAEVVRVMGALGAVSVLEVVG